MLSWFISAVSRVSPTCTGRSPTHTHTCPVPEPSQAAHHRSLAVSSRESHHSLYDAACTQEYSLCVAGVLLVHLWTAGRRRSDRRLGRSQGAETMAWKFGPVIGK